VSTELVHIGFGNTIAVNRAIALLAVNQQPVKRLIRQARDKDLLIDATHGRKAKAAILFDTGHVGLAAISPDTIVHRLTTPSSPIEERIEL